MPFHSSPSKYRGSVDRSRPLPSKYFPICLSSFHSTLHSLSYWQPTAKQTIKTRKVIDSELYPKNLNRKMIPYWADRVRSLIHTWSQARRFATSLHLALLYPHTRRGFGLKNYCSSFFQAWSRHTRPFQGLSFPMPYLGPALPIVVPRSNWPRLSSVTHYIHPPEIQWPNLATFTFKVK
jgi:hypothetical protein